MVRKVPGRSSSVGQNFFLFLLVIVAGYNAYETVQLKAEVAELRAAKHRPSSVTIAESAPRADTNPSSLFDQARKEVAQARERLHIKDYDKARSDLQQGVASLERANTQTRAEGEKVLAELRTAAQGLSDKPITSSNSGHDTGDSAPKDDARKTDPGTR